MYVHMPVPAGTYRARLVGAAAGARGGVVDAAASGTFGAAGAAPTTRLCASRTAAAYGVGDSGAVTGLATAAGAAVPLNAAATPICSMATMTSACARRAAGVANSRIGPRRWVTRIGE